MSDKLQEAASRFRSEAYDAVLHAEMHEQPLQRSLDASMLARTYLDEYRADDGNPLTEEWLRSVGFKSTGKFALTIDQKNEPELCTFSLRCADYANLPCRWELWNVFDDKTPAEGSCLPCVPKTRGDVRRLCACLVIELKEPSCETNAAKLPS